MNNPTNPTSMTPRAVGEERMSEERLEEIRKAATETPTGKVWASAVIELLDELDAVRAERRKLADAAERAVMWFDQFAAEPEDTTVMHELQEALGQPVEHDPRRCRCE